MAKDVWVNGDNVPPSYLNAINGTDGSTGIVLDGVDDNGHGAKLLAGAHIDASQLVPNVNLEILDTFDIDASFDGGSTFAVTNVECVLQRISDQVCFHITEQISGSMASANNVQIKRSDAANWNTAYFGSTTSHSTASVASINAFYNPCIVKFTGVANNLLISSLKDASAGNFAMSAAVIIFAHTNFTWYKDV